MSAKGAINRVQINDASMANGLPSTAEIRRGGWDYYCGVHGIMRERRGIKRGTSAARRRHDKQVVRDHLEQM